LLKGLRPLIFHLFYNELFAMSRNPGVTRGLK
jgi:hypothetical protein